VRDVASEENEGEKMGWENGKDMEKEVNGKCE